jgi:endonuclease-3
MKATKVDWSEAIKPLLKKYKNEKHPLKARNAYEMLVMVVLSAQTTDALINNIADELFKAFPDMQALSKATPELLYPYINKVRGFNKKAKWLIDIAQQVKNDKNILAFCCNGLAHLFAETAGERPYYLCVGLVGDGAKKRW